MFIDRDNVEEKKGCMKDKGRGWRKNKGEGRRRRKEKEGKTHFLTWLGCCFQCSFLALYVSIR
jgi:hypothetical protein